MKDDFVTQLFSSFIYNAIKELELHANRRATFAEAPPRP